MADRSVPPNRTSLLGIHELLRGTREAQSLCLAGNDRGRSAHARTGEELFLVAVSAEMRDLLYTRLIELQQSSGEVRADCKYVTFAGWELDLLERHLIAPGGGVIHLPGLEYSLLRVFVGRPRQPLSRSELALLIIRLGQPYLSIRTVDSYVCRLRRRLSVGGAASLISTVHKLGYSFDADVVRMGD
jgi:DNA-binding response OmpR family regulator